MITTIIVIGLVAIGLLGFVGNRRAEALENWTVGERDIPRWTSWFLQAGENLTTFSFLGLAGIAFTSGINAVYAIAYLTISLTGLYFFAPRVRRLGAARGYLTMGDYLKDRLGSSALSKVAALIGSLALIPYLVLQISGLGQVVQLATGSESASGLSMVIASVLVVVFVLWAGIRGIARVATFKDIGMVIALVLVTIAAIVAFGGVPDLFSKVYEKAPELLTVNNHGYDATFFINAVLVTSIGASFNSMPHLWAPTFAAKSGRILRSNYKWLGLYQILLFGPILVGLVALFLVPKDTVGNAVLFTVSHHTMPAWLVAIVAVFGAAAAMVPSAAIAMGISTQVSRNLIPTYSAKATLRVNHATVVVVIVLALLFGLAKSDMGQLLLLTYGGTTQLVPAIVAGLPRKVSIGWVPLLIGMVAGTLFVVIITFGKVPIGNWDSGLLGLILNVVIVAVAEAIRRGTRKSSPDASAQEERVAA
jgi:SSS family solute:Na+ symporter